MTPEQERVWSEVGHVKASQYRRAVVTHLGIGPATPTQLEDATSYDITHLSRALRELQDVDVVELLVPEDTKKGRYYTLTGLGERVVERLTERDHDA